jgi:NAD(P)-dependent dehydrogenase (short-subunit alcohol dehydrogenase family)
MKFVITGAAQGIGFELTQLALAQKAEVIAAVRNPESAKDLNAVKAQNDHLTIVKMDVSQLADIENFKKSLEGRPVDVLINNAGIYDQDKGPGPRTLADHRAELESVMAVNTVAPYLLSRALAANLLAAQSPRLVTITSLMGSISDNSSGGSYAYRMSKAALNMFAKTYAIDNPEVLTLTLHPGWVRTRMGGSGAPVTPKESAQGLFNVIMNAKPEQTGRFFDFRGKELPW